MAIAEACLLTGLETYDATVHHEMYVAQMRIIAKFIYEGFGYLTAEEITNAFHLNLQGKYQEVYKQYGKKQINCEFIGQVLSGYRKYKQDYVNNNESVKRILQPPPKQEVIEYVEDPVNEERVMIEREYQVFLRNPEWHCKLLLDSFYNRLVADELISTGFYERFLRKSQVSLLREKQLIKLVPTSVQKVRDRDSDGNIGFVIKKNFDNHKQLDSELHQLRNGSSGDVKRYARQMAVAGYFKYCLKREMKNIYIRG